MSRSLINTMVPHYFLDLYLAVSKNAIVIPYLLSKFLYSFTHHQLSIPTPTPQTHYHLYLPLTHRVPPPLFITPTQNVHRPHLPPPLLPLLSRPHLRSLPPLPPEYQLC